MQNDWLAHALARTRWRPQSQVAALFVLGIALTLIFGGLYLSQVASFATMNREIEALIAQRDRLERTNEQLRGQIAGLETVPQLLERARQLGFRPATPQDIEYLVIDGYNPNRARTVAPLVIEERMDEGLKYDETFSGWLQQQFDSLRRQFETFGQ
ncbi:MAG: hypothetical protein RML73_00920 [Anaerolineae bacterium]|nr:hypothetical protein [Anaerolineae bacterium]